MNTVIYFIILAVFFITSTIIYVVTNNKKRDVRNRKVILFTLIFSAAITLFGFSGMIIDASSTFWYFVLLQVIFLGIGYIASFLLKRNAFGEFNNPPLSNVMFLIMNVTAGMAGFTFLFNYLNHSELGQYYALSALTFVLPQFLATSFQAYTEIPMEIYKIWYYPDTDVDIDDIDTSVVYMLELEYSKSANDNRLVNTKSRAPLGMKFGDWFQLYVEHQNHKNPDDPIHYHGEDHAPYGWIFYVKPSFLASPRFIDTSLTIKENRLKEKNKIIARRVNHV